MVDRGGAVGVNFVLTLGEQRGATDYGKADPCWERIRRSVSDIEFSLAPSGTLYWGVQDSNAKLVQLATERGEISPLSSYWRDFSRRYLSLLCHLPENAESLEVPEPSDETLEAISASAPPMLGGEYLDGEALRKIWQSLHHWVLHQVFELGTLEDFLQRYAPRWRQVGRVFFHLAENKSDPERPFAFMVTYSTGLNAEGKLKHLPLAKGLEQYSGAKNKQALIKLLSPLRSAGEELPWVQELIDSTRIYKPSIWSPQQAYQLLRCVPQLEQSGVCVLLPDWWKRRPRPRVSVTVGAQPGAALGVDALMQFDVSVALGDQEITARELAQLLKGEEGLVQLKGQWVEVDAERLRQALDQWQVVQKRAARGEIGFAEGMRLLAGDAADASPDDDVEERSWALVRPNQEFEQLLDQLRQPERSQGADPNLRATLRPYQEVGLNWMRLVTGMGLGACLADDMGLGKTVQVLALLLEKRGPSLLVVPASLLGNWKREGERFAPSLRMLLAHPSECDKQTLERLGKDPQRTLADVDLVVTTYAMLGRQSWLHEMTWQTVILDEAQAIKNPSTSQTKAVKKLSSRSRVAMTGTPVENRLGDLWSLFDFLNPGLLGSPTVFKGFLKEMETRPHNKFAPLRRLVGPYILRRKKTDRAIISDLPDKIEAPGYCGLSKAQIKLYERTVQTMRQALDQADGMARRGLVLQTLMRLKQICNHPAQFSGTGDFVASESGKFLRLAELCQEISERQEKVLVFTQFKEIVDPLSDHLATVFGRSGLILHGQTQVKERQKLVERFQQESGPPFFVLSLKAGGTGLTLTQASHVIHFDRWWNPAVENQATDRAFRIGQQRNVLVHKFITRGTLEERIDDVITKKQRLADEILEAETEINLTELSNEELLDLVKLDVTQASV